MTIKPLDNALRARARRLSSLISCYADRVNNWAAVAVIIFVYAVGAYYQNKRIADFKEALDRYLDAKFAAIEHRFAVIEKRLDAIECRLE